MNQSLVEQYVAGKMGEAQADAFEESCLANPELARQVEFEQRLKDGLAQVARGSTAEFVRSGPSGFWKLAVAASVLLCVTASVWVWQRAPQANVYALAAVIPEQQRGGISMRLALVRGAGNIPELPRGEVRVAIAGLFDPGSHYSISLDRLHSHQPAQTIATLQGQHPASPDTLEVMVDSDQLEAGSYSLRVRRQNSDEEALDFVFLKP